MSFAAFFRIDLRRLILLLATFSALVTLANGFYASYQVQRQQLMDSALESNRAYARKLAESVEDFLQAAQQQLVYSAAVLGEHFDDAQLLTAEVHRLRQQTNTFNSVSVVDAEGWVRAVSPETLQVKGHRLDSAGSIEALRERRALISQPFVSVAGNLLVLVSQPIIDRKGRYLGYVGGTIYLKQKSILNNLLGQHYYRDGSYLYVVDPNRRLLYHPQPDRAGAYVEKNGAIDAVLRGEHGAMRLDNSQGVDMLAGYAPIAFTSWGIVTQRPTRVVLAALDDLMYRVLSKTLPWALLLLGLIWLSSRLIARPLWQLADGVRYMDRASSVEHIHNVRSWYFETSELKRAMLVGVNLLHQQIGKLHLDAQTDSLTGLHNRRGMDEALAVWQAAQHPFAVVALDIDHFKRVNDVHGHAVGDQVLQRLAQLMAECARSGDVLCRVGGEEFLMLLPSASVEVAEQVAQRLRVRLEQTDIPPVGRITLSLGVAQWPQHSSVIAEVLEVVDSALYEAKRTGRNKVVVAAATDAPAAA
ncbi:MAG: GGDEF domain-containing protein [Giesbergeria sp.]|nr:GGDEF domain-containing protein [Giesbergeria sp.]